MYTAGILLSELALGECRTSHGITDDYGDDLLGACNLLVHAAGANEVVGTIPDVPAANLSRLQLLDLSSNRLTGALQAAATQPHC